MAVSPITVGMSRAAVKNRLMDVVTSRVLGRSITRWSTVQRILNFGTPPEYQIQEKDSGAAIIQKTGKYHFTDRALRSRRPNVLFENGEKGGWFTLRQPEHVFKNNNHDLSDSGDPVMYVRNMINFGGNEEVKMILGLNQTPAPYRLYQDNVGFIELAQDKYNIDASSIGTAVYYIYAVVASGLWTTGSINSNKWTLSLMRPVNYLFIDRQLTSTEVEWLRTLFQNDAWLLATGNWVQSSYWNPLGLWPTY